MSLQSVLSHPDWWRYEDDKKKRGVDARFFSCTEPWEVDYLVRFIRERHSEFTDATIRAAITVCCTKVGGNHPRDKFVECVMTGLKVS